MKTKIQIKDSTFFIRQFEDPIMGDMVDVYDEYSNWLGEIQGNTEDEEDMDILVQTIEADFI